MSDTYEQYMQRIRETARKAAQRINGYMANWGDYGCAEWDTSETLNHFRHARVTHLECIQVSALEDAGESLWLATFDQELLPKMGFHLQKNRVWLATTKSFVVADLGNLEALPADENEPQRTTNTPELALEALD